MLQNLFSGRSKSKKTTSKQVQTDSTLPDISRVIRMSPAAAAPADEEVSASPVAIADKAEAAVESLSNQFEEWMRADLAKLRAAWAEAKEQATPETYRQLFTAAHNIRGVAGSYGYPAISRLCGSLCTLVSSSLPGERAALINLHVEACRAAHNSMAQGSGPQSVANAVCDALESQVSSTTTSIKL